jgi:hypothetical protein
MQPLERLNDELPVHILYPRIERSVGREVDREQTLVLARDDSAKILVQEDNELAIVLYSPLEYIDCSGDHTCSICFPDGEESRDSGEEK